MDLEKRKYKRKDVIDIIDGLNAEHQEIIDKLRSEIAVLSEKNQRLSGELSLIQDKEHLIDSTLIDAKKQAEDILSNANTQYLAVIESLKKFSDNWKTYFKMISEKYPLYPSVQQAVKIKQDLDKILKGKDYSGGIAKLDTAVTTELKNMQFSPKNKVKEYVVATSDNGFNINEVLNPVDIELEDICKELGLMDD